MSSFSGYYEKELGLSDWAIKTGLYFNSLYESTEYKGKFYQHPIHEIGCKDALCRLSFPVENTYDTNPAVIDYFAKVPESDEYQYMTFVMEKGSEGEAHVYFFRDM